MKKIFTVNDVSEFEGRIVAITPNDAFMFDKGITLPEGSVVFGEIDSQQRRWTQGREEGSDTGYNMLMFCTPDDPASNNLWIDAHLNPPYLKGNKRPEMRLATAEELGALEEAIITKKAKLEFKTEIAALRIIDDAMTELCGPDKGSSKGMGR